MVQLKELDAIISTFYYFVVREPIPFFRLCFAFWRYYLPNTDFNL